MLDKSATRLSLAVLVAALLLVGFNAPSLNAQAITQTIQGLVTDATGAVIPGASVTLTNRDTGVTSTIQTNETGNYTYPQVPVGNYDITCQLDGFKTDNVSNQRVETGAQVRHNFTLEIGDVTETVEVSAAAITLNTENAVVGGVVENKRVIELPLNGRNIVALAVLVPGVQYGQRTGMANGQGGFPIPGSGYSVSANGQREIHQVVSLDGVDAKDPRIHITNFVPSIEAIEEFKIQTNAYSAEVGFGGGAVTSITMKSGTNAFHGTLFEFLRNEALDAEAYFLNFELASGEARRPKQQLRRNQYGMVLSGPVIKNKTFWAFNWEARRENTSSIQTAWFPSNTFKNGDYSRFLAPTARSGGGQREPFAIFDPYTGNVFPNNQIPASQIHAGSLNALNLLIPSPGFQQADPLDFTNRANVVQPIKEDQYYGRLDHYFNDSDRVFARLAASSGERLINNINPKRTSTSSNDVYNLATQWIHTFNQNAINEFRFGFNQAETNPFHFYSNTDFDPDTLGIGEIRVAGDNNRPLTSLETGPPRISGARFNWTVNGNTNVLDTYQFSDHLSVIKGSHNLKFGGEYYWITMDRAAANLPSGHFRFNSAQSGDGFSSYLLGLPSQTETAEGWPRTVPRAGRQAYYFNDDWKASSKLTLNLGVRLEYIGNSQDALGLQRVVAFPGEPFDRGPYFTDPADGVEIPTFFPGAGTVNDPSGKVNLWKQQKVFYQPRVGIAFRPAEGWVVRAGAGYFSNIDHMNTWTILNLNPPLSGSNNFLAVTDPTGTATLNGIDGPVERTLNTFRPGAPILTLDDPYLTNTVGAVAAPKNVNTLTVPSDQKTGDVWKWSFDIQKEMFFDTSLTIGYVGSAGRHAGNSVRNYNSPSPSPDSDIQSNRPWQRLYDPATPELGVQNLATIRYLDSFANTFHHGLQMKLDKRFSQGVAFGLAYTFSKSHGDGENGGQQGAQFQDPRNCLVCDRGRFRFDQRHNFVGHWVWEMPGQNLSGPIRHILGGWQQNGILSLRTGFPLNITNPRGDLNVADSNIRPDRLADGALSNHSRKLWYDPTAFLRTTCDVPDLVASRCHFGDSGYNILDNPGQVNLDFGFFKNFNITETVKVQFRWELFNATNTPYFGAPGGISFSSVNTLVPDGSRNGEIRRTNVPMRIQQFALKFFF
jgi:hypothetical protein